MVNDPLNNVQTEKYWKHLNAEYVSADPDGKIFLLEIVRHVLANIMETHGARTGIPPLLWGLNHKNTPELSEALRDDNHFTASKHLDCGVG